MMAHRIEEDVSQGGALILEFLTFEAALPEPPGAIVFATGAARDLFEQALPEGLGTRSQPRRKVFLFTLAVSRDVVDPVNMPSAGLPSIEAFLPAR